MLGTSFWGAADPLNPTGRRSRTAIYRSLQEAKAELDRLGGLPAPDTAQNIWGDIRFAEVHNSTAIEGNTLVLKEVEALIHDERYARALGNKELKDYLEVSGYAKASDWVYSQALTPVWTGNALITLGEVREVHRLTMEQVWPVSPHPLAGPLEGPGCYRRHDIQPFPGGMIPPMWTSLDVEMHSWVDAVCAGLDKALPVSETIAAWAASFQRIHPFIDGNGRTGRLVVNLLLIRLGYPPAIIYKRQRDAYLMALHKADAGSIRPLGELYARAILDTLYRFIVPVIADPSELVPLASLVDASVSLSALRQAAERGRVKSQRTRNRQWRSTQRWVEDYKASRHRRQGIDT